MKIRYKFVDGEISEVEVTEEIGSVIVESISEGSNTWPALLYSFRAAASACSASFLVWKPPFSFFVLLPFAKKN